MTETKNEAFYLDILLQKLEIAGKAEEIIKNYKKLQIYNYKWLFVEQVPANERQINRIGCLQLCL
jgi:hypothetical protein